MKHFGGWQFPDGEVHLIDWMRQMNREVGGRLSYQWPKIELALQHVRSWRRAVDAGAHVGLWAWHLAGRFRQVDAFEPVPRHRECFALNVKAENVALHPFALGATSGQTSFVVYPGNSGHTQVAVNEPGDLAAEVRPLDSFGFADLDFLKVDCEGYEHEVLRGGAETLIRCRPVLIVEQKPGNGSRYGFGDRDAVRFLEGLGAHVVAEISGDFVMRWA